MRFKDYFTYADLCVINQHPTISNRCVCEFSYCGTNCVSVVFTKRHVREILSRYYFPNVKINVADYCLGK